VLVTGNTTSGARRRFFEAFGPSPSTAGSESARQCGTGKPGKIRAVGHSCVRAFTPARTHSRSLIYRGYRARAVTLKKIKWQVSPNLLKRHSGTAKPRYGTDYKFMSPVMKYIYHKPSSFY
jgi:hypothetical protein